MDRKNMMNKEWTHGTPSVTPTFTFILSLGMVPIYFEFNTDKLRLNI